MAGLSLEDGVEVPPALSARLEFETFLADLSARFVNMPAEHIDRKIVEAQRRICEFLGLGLSSLWQPSPRDPHAVLLTHWYMPPDAPPPPENMDAAVYFPWTLREARSGKTVAFARVAEMPPEAGRDIETYAVYGIKSGVSFPLGAGGGPVIGILGFAALDRERDWPEAIVNRCRLVAQVFANALARKRSEDELAARLGFQTLLADLSARFVAVPAECVDREITDAQRRLCEILGTDRSTVWQSSPHDGGAMRLTHTYQPPDVPPPDGDMEGRAYFPWVVREVLSGKTLALASMADVPPDADRDLQSFAKHRTKSALIFPLAAGGGPVFGILTFAVVRQEREWPQAVVSRCNVIAQVLANSLARKFSDHLLRDSEERYRAITLNLPGLVYQFYARDDGKQGLYYVDPRAAEVCGLSPDPLDTFFDRFAACVAPECRENWLASIRHAISNLTPCEQEFRFIKPTGEPIFLRAVCETRRLPGEVVFYGVMRDVTEQRRVQDQLHRTLEELNLLKEQLHHENVYLRKEVQTLQGQNPIVGGSESLRDALAKAQQVAATDSTVLILGETGTGKELLASYLHRIGRRSHKPFITTNIAAIPGTLLESELFGREKGAYTGALTKQIGRFEMADGGTLFLDEIGEMPLETQAKLLRVLQRGEFERLGSGKTLRADVQVIAATNRKLPELIREGKFRQDLFYRLNVFPITLPSLRDRPEDIPALVWSFVQEFSERMGKPIDRIRKKELEALQAHDWPGNVRELRNVVERSMILAGGPELRLVLPEADSVQPSLESRGMRDVERAHIEKVLKSAGGRIRGPRGAAEILGLKPTTLYAMMDRLGIEYRK